MTTREIIVHATCMAWIFSALLGLVALHMTDKWEDDDGDHTAEG